MKNFLVIILAAGKGTRLNSDHPKVLHTVNNKPMIHHVIETVQHTNISDICLVVGYKKELVMDACKKYAVTYITQNQQLGTGHAIICAIDEIKASECDHVIILAGDCPLIQTNTLKQLMTKHTETKASATLLTSKLDDAKQYGRILRNTNQNIIGIREAKDCSTNELMIQEFNSGIYCFNKSDLLHSISNLTNNNTQNEYYLTDTIQLLSDTERTISGICIQNSLEVLGVNTQKELEALNHTFQN